MNLRKRVFDVVLSGVALVILCPVWGLVALVVLLDDGTPVLFRQKRVGYQNQLFTIYKFRTMRRSVANLPQCEATAQASCFTRTGRRLRGWSLDELPQLWNIFRGDMSFVGPRPLIPEEDAIRAAREAAGVFALKPGLTGLAQIHGRAQMDDEEKLSWDKQYLETQSFRGDLLILLKTFLQVLKRDEAI